MMKVIDTWFPSISTLMLLYSFVAEMPSLQLKSNNEIISINISNMQKKIIQHTDDIKMTLKDLKSFHISVSTWTSKLNKLHSIRIS